MAVVRFPVRREGQLQFQHLIHLLAARRELDSIILDELEKCRAELEKQAAELRANKAAN